MPTPHAQSITLSPPQPMLLESLTRQSSCPQGVAQRVRIVLAAAAGETHETIAVRLHLSLPTIRKWRRRWSEAEAQLAVDETDPTALRTRVMTVLHDAPRSGAPATFCAEQIVQIVNLACTPPSDTGRPVSAWTPRERADEAIKQGIVSTISARTVGRFVQ